MTDREQNEDRELSPTERAALSAWETPLAPPDGFEDRVVTAWNAERTAGGGAPETGTRPLSTTPPRGRRIGLAVGGLALAASVLAAVGGVTLMTADRQSAVMGGQSLDSWAPSATPPVSPFLPASPPSQIGDMRALNAPRPRVSGREPSARDLSRGGALGLVSPRTNRVAPSPEPAALPPDDRSSGVVAVERDPFSTFAIDVDTGSYTMVRRAILEHLGLPREAVRVEELLNYFHYRDDPPTDGRPFSVSLEAAPSPWTAGRDLVRVALRAREIPPGARKPAHLVFLVDVSGSMSSPDKLPLAQQSLRMLTESLGPQDTVAIVTYASGTSVVLPPTGMQDRPRIFAAIDALSAGGSTAMGSGLELAYELAVRQVRPETVSRVIVLSDGDANVGATSHEQILARIRGYVSEGVTLSTVGFGTGNYRDGLMEQLADRGNGNYTYVDGPAEARRIFVEQLGGTLEVVAQDVKVQVEWNPRAVRTYRLVGYENRAVADEDFRNDHVDAGEIGAGHAVTALYEIERVPGGDATLALVRLRAKRPGGGAASEDVYRFDTERLHLTFDSASDDLRFAAAVMGFAAFVRGGPEADGVSIEKVRAIARAATRAGDRDRAELLELIDILARDPSARPVR